MQPKLMRAARGALAWNDEVLKVALQHIAQHDALGVEGIQRHIKRTHGLAAHGGVTQERSGNTAERRHGIILPLPVRARSDMTHTEADILIIGAGGAGLAAAAELAPSGRRVLLLEARDRIGGRMWTLHAPDLAAPIEYGAEFIHGEALTTMAILRRGGRAAIESTDTHFRLQDGELAARNEFFHDVQRAMRASSALERQDLSFDDFLEQSKDLSVEARRYAKMMAEGFDAADTGHASARAIAAEWTGEMMNDDAPQSRPQGGYDALIATLAGSAQSESVHLQLQTTVRSVRWSQGSVLLEGTFLGKPFRASARRAIITLPLGVLQQPPDAPGAVDFNPALDEKRSSPAGTRLRSRDQAHAALQISLSGRSLMAAAIATPPSFMRRIRISGLSGRSCRCARHCSSPGAVGRRRRACHPACTSADIVARALGALQSMFGKRCERDGSF
jgi:phytoene dehydrogenase-like protein